MADRVELAFRRTAAQLIPDGTTVLAAVSGGADSVTLLELLVRYARSRKIEIHVAHLDHALRRGSRTDRRFVEQLCERHGLPCLADRIDVAAERRKGESPEESARRVRRAFLLKSMRRSGATCIAMGHTLDDQAETVLMRLVRGAGPAALTGMAPRGPGPFVRPLLGLEKSELLAYLGRHDLPFREDSTNRNLRFDRNRVRKLLLPALAETLNPRASRHLVGAAERLREDVSYLDGLAEERFADVAGRTRSGAVTLPPRELAEAPRAMATRMARLALLRAGIDARRITSRHIGALIDLARGPSRKRLNLPGGITASRLSGRTLLVRPADR